MTGSFPLSYSMVLCLGLALIETASFQEKLFLAHLLISPSHRGLLMSFLVKLCLHPPAYCYSVIGTLHTLLPVHRKVPFVPRRITNTYYAFVGCVCACVYAILVPEKKSNFSDLWLPAYQVGPLAMLAAI